MSRPIVVGVDGSDSAEHAVRWAAREAVHRHVQLRLVRTCMVAHRLIEVVRDAQLVVVGSRGRGGVVGMVLGSTSQALLHHSPCPVAVVRPDTGN